MIETVSIGYPKLRVRQLNGLIAAKTQNKIKQKTRRLKLSKVHLTYESGKWQKSMFLVMNAK